MKTKKCYTEIDIFTKNYSIVGHSFLKKEDEDICTCNDCGLVVYGMQRYINENAIIALTKDGNLFFPKK